MKKYLLRVFCVLFAVFLAFTASSCGGKSAYKDCLEHLQKHVYGEINVLNADGYKYKGKDGTIIAFKFYYSYTTILGEEDDIDYVYKENGNFFCSKCLGGDDTAYELAATTYSLCRTGGKQIYSTYKK